MEALGSGSAIDSSSAYVLGMANLENTELTPCVNMLASSRFRKKSAKRRHAPLHSLVRILAKTAPCCSKPVCALSAQGKHPAAHHRCGASQAEVKLTTSFWKALMHWSKLGCS